MKEKIYRKVSLWGMKALSILFPEYFAKEPLSPSDRYIEYPFVISNLPKPPLRILDVGCSGSFFPLLLSSMGYYTYGIDLREYPILKRIKFDNFKFIKGDITKTTFSDKSFDAITAISTIEHIGLSGRYGEKGDLSGDKNALTEMTRILKAGGVILLTLPFGKAKIIKPYSRIYDGKLIRQLIGELGIEKEEYFIQDSQDNWHRCSQQQAEAVDAKCDRYPLCLIKLVKK